MQREQLHRPEQTNKHQKHKKPGQQSSMIKIYTMAVCLSCLYLQTQYFQPILNDKRAYYMSLLTYFDVFMCLLSYIQTIRIKNRLPKLSKIDKTEQQNEKFYDHSYSITHNHCNNCDNYKFPRVSHCSNCGQCQYKMDHHCVWTQTCIGFRNQKCFYLFCFYMAIGVCQFWYFTFRVIKQQTVPLFELVQPGVLILWLFTAFSAFFVGLMIIILLASHTLMVFTNYRTLDGMKNNQYCPAPFCNTKQNPDNLNLFDRGQIQNIKSIFGKQWWLWWFPNARQIENEFYPEPMSPHPDPLKLMQETTLYDLEMKFNQEMQRVHERNLLSVFVGKKMLINGKVLYISKQPTQQKPKAKYSFDQLS